MDTLRAIFTGVQTHAVTAITRTGIAVGHLSITRAVAQCVQLVVGDGPFVPLAGEFLDGVIGAFHSTFFRIGIKGLAAVARVPPFQSPLAKLDRLLPESDEHGFDVDHRFSAGPSAAETNSAIRSSRKTVPVDAGRSKPSSNQGTTPSSRRPPPSPQRHRRSPRRTGRVLQQEIQKPGERWRRKQPSIMSTER